MTYLVSVLIAGLLFFSFLLVTMYEGRRGVRFFAASRYRLDGKIAKTQYLMEHVDWGAFTAHLTKTSLQTIAHDAAHGTLLAVRAAERGLTRATRSLRMARTQGALPPHEEHPSGFSFLSQNFRKPRETRPMNDIVRKSSGE